jgi:hypothetical protein
MKKIMFFISLLTLISFVSNSYAIDFVKETKKIINKKKGEYFEEIDRSPLFSFQNLWDLINNTPYVSPYLLMYDDTYSTEIYKSEFVKLQKLFDLSNNKFEKIFYLYQAILVLYKNGDYPELERLNVTLKDYGLQNNVLNLRDNIKKNIDQLEEEQIDYQLRVEEELAKQRSKQAKIDFSKAIKMIGDEGFKDLFYLFLYSFQFEEAKLLLTKIQRSYLQNPLVYDECEYQFETYVRYFGDLSIPKINLVHLINKEYIDPDKLFDINNPDVSFLIAYKKNITLAKDYYYDLLNKRIDLMEKLLPYLYFADMEYKFRDAYEKVIFVKQKPPSNLDLTSANFKVSQLKGVYKKVLHDTVYNAYYELANNMNLKSAEKLISEVEKFDPANYIYNIDKNNI